MNNINSLSAPENNEEGSLAPWRCGDSLYYTKTDKSILPEHQNDALDNQSSTMSYFLHSQPEKLSEMSLQIPREVTKNTTNQHLNLVRSERDLLAITNTHASRLENSDSAAAPQARSMSSLKHNSNSPSEWTGRHREASVATIPLSLARSFRNSVGSGVGFPLQQPGYFDLSTYQTSDNPAANPTNNHLKGNHKHYSPSLSIESLGSSNSVPFVPPPPTPSRWKNFCNTFTIRVVTRHIKFVLAFYFSSLMTLIRPISQALGPSPYLANITVIFMHPARTIGSQLEVTLFSVIGVIIAMIWNILCQLCVTAFNRHHLPKGNTNSWAIEALWFFTGIWIMTTLKARYAKLVCTFQIFTMTSIFALNKMRISTEVRFRDCLDLLGPMLIGVFISLTVNIFFWPETASDGLGRALSESLDSSRALLNLSTRSFLLNHQAIALPRSAMEKAQTKVKSAQKKLLGAYREARYEVTYSITNPVDYKEARAVISMLMRHLGAMSLVVQNERLLMLGHPDRDNNDLHSDGSVSPSLSYGGSSGSMTEKVYSRVASMDFDNSIDSFNSSKIVDPDTRANSSSSQTRVTNESFDTIPCQQPQVSNPSNPQRRGSTAELKRVRQLLMRAEASTERIMKARKLEKEKHEAERQQKQQQQEVMIEGEISPIRHARKNSQSTLLENKLEAYTHIKAPFPSSSSSVASSTESESTKSVSDNHQSTIRSFRSLFSVTSKKSSIGFKRSSPPLFKTQQSLDNTSDDNALSPGNSPMSSEDTSNLKGTLSHTIAGTPMPLKQRRLSKIPIVLKYDKSSREQKKKWKRAVKELRQEQEKRSEKKKKIKDDRIRPPKEVAFGDRRLFMTFLGIVKDPLQRLSDSCSKSMVSLERELVAGLNVERDRQERIRKRSAERQSILRKVIAQQQQQQQRCHGAEGDEESGDKEDSAPRNSPMQHHSPHDIDNEISPNNVGPIKSLWDQIMSIGKSHSLTKEEMDYAMRLKHARVMKKKNDDGEIDSQNHSPTNNGASITEIPRVIESNDPVTEAQDKGDDDTGIPFGTSYVDYITHELEVFDQAESASLQKFISYNPTLDVGPREEIFLIFFFIFALREISRELLRLAKHVENLNEKQRKEMEASGRTVRKRKFWWPKVVNFWSWIGWVGYSQTKVSGGYSGMVKNTTRLYEKQEPRYIPEDSRPTSINATDTKISAAEQERKESELPNPETYDQLEEARTRHRSCFSMGVAFENDHPSIQNNSHQGHQWMQESEKSRHLEPQQKRHIPIPTVSIHPLSPDLPSKDIQEEGYSLPTDSYNNADQIFSKEAEYPHFSSNPIHHTVIEFSEGQTKSKALPERRVLEPDQQYQSGHQDSSWYEGGMHQGQSQGDSRPGQPLNIVVKKRMTWRMRVWTWLQTFKSDEVRYGFKMSATMSFIGLWAWLDWDDQIFALDRGQWAMMTVMAVLWPTVGAMIKVIILRSIGTVIGVVWALLTYLACPNNPYVICAMMLPITFISAYFILVSTNPRLGIILILAYSSVTFTYYHGRTDDSIYQLSYKRAIAVILGCLFCAIVNTFLWPVLARNELRKEIASLIGKQGVLFAEMVNRFLLEEPNIGNTAEWSGKVNGIHPTEGSTKQNGNSTTEANPRIKQDSAHALEQPKNQQQQQQQQRQQQDNVNKDRQTALKVIEQQLQTRLINIGQLLEQSKSEPRLKEDFPVELYTQIIKCCQNILDRMVSMRMAAQLLAPDVRELVTGPMNFYRHDMVGALLMYFNVLSSSLASKSPLPPYLPSARMARLRVMFSVRKAIALDQTETGRDHYTYIYYYVFSSALEEVIEELELLAILVKPLVGITIISQTESYEYGYPVDYQSNFIGPMNIEPAYETYYPRMDRQTRSESFRSSEDGSSGSSQIQVQQRFLREQVKLQRKNQIVSTDSYLNTSRGLMISTPNSQPGSENFFQDPCSSRMDHNLSTSYHAHCTIQQTPCLGPLDILESQESQYFGTLNPTRYENAMQLAVEASGNCETQTSNPDLPHSRENMPVLPVHTINLGPLDVPGYPRYKAVAPTVFTGMFSPTIGGTVGSPSVLKRQLEKRLQVDSTIMQCLSPGRIRETTNSPKFNQNAVQNGPLSPIQRTDGIKSQGDSSSNISSDNNIESASPRIY